jgi:hypothetical protein
MINTDHITRQVLKNCDISDSKHAGLYSICGLALRLRDLFKWEKHLDPWMEKDSSEILDWIGLKEDLWAHLDGREYCRLSINGKSFDPFDTENINNLLVPHGILYGAGYAHSLKPTFFLAVINNKLTIGNLDVFVLEQELARDLLTLPALSQDNQVLFRKDSAKLFFWDQLFYLKKSGQPFLWYALQKCGIEKADPKSLRQHLSSLLDLYQDTYIYHELGEIKDTDFDKNIWREIIGAYPQSIVEYFTRTIKDLLADTNAHGTLHHIVREHKDISLGLYAAFFDGLARSLFPELRASIKHFCKSGDWKEIKKAVTAGYDTARRGKDMIIALYREGLDREDNQWIEKKIEAHVNNLQNYPSTYR